MNRYKTMRQVPAETAISRAMSKELAARGFKFCGPTIVYAFMQAVGMVNDHLVTCYRHEAVQKLRRKVLRLVVCWMAASRARSEMSGDHAVAARRRATLKKIAANNVSVPMTV